MNPLQELLELAGQKDELEHKTLNAVAKARADKHSWQAIANMLGGTKQRAQQKYGSAVEPLLVQGKYECSCGWTMVYPGWEAEEAREEIAEHRDMHEREDERDEYGTEPAQLEDEDTDAAAPIPLNAPNGQPIYLPSIGDTPATRAAEIHGQRTVDVFQQFAADRASLKAEAAARQLAAEPSKIVDAPAPALSTWEDPTPRRTSAAAVQLDQDSESDMARVESGELDTAGNTIDWTGVKAGHCLYCEKTHHYSGKGRNLYFWIYPGCNPTHRDGTQHKA